MDRLADRPHRLGEELDGLVGRHIARLKMDACGAAIVARDEAMQDLGQEAALLGPQAPHDAEVDGNDLAGRVDQEIALM
jgi:hypothetical protein